MVAQVRAWEVSSRALLGSTRSLPQGLRYLVIRNIHMHGVLCWQVWQKISTVLPTVCRAPYMQQDFQPLSARVGLKTQWLWHGFTAADGLVLCTAVCRTTATWQLQTWQGGIWSTATLATATSLTLTAGETTRRRLWHYEASKLCCQCLCSLYLWVRSAGWHGCANPKCL